MNNSFRSLSGRLRSFTLARIDGCLLAGFILFYVAVGSVLLPYLPLWLDEIIQVYIVRVQTLGDVLWGAARSAGGVPMGYVVSFCTLKVLDYSEASARAPSLFFSSLACIGVFVLARRSGLKQPMLAVILFAILPIQFRYATEARPYSMALCISIWSTVAILRLRTKPTVGRLMTYVALAVLGIYSQPYSLFVPVAHFLWFALSARESRRQLLYSGVALVIAGLLFLPWYLYAAPFWRNEIQLSPAHLRFSDGLRILRELIGAGYLGTLILLAAGVYGSRKLAQKERQFWILYLIVPVLGAVIGDISFAYFFAVRQMIYVTVPLSLMAALGIERISQRSPMSAAGFVACILFSFVYSSTSFFLRPREDWKAASARLAAETQRGACVMLSPDASSYIYSLFQPGFSQHICPADCGRFEAIAVATSPYYSSQRHMELEANLVERGWREIARYRFSGPEVVVFRKGRLKGVKSRPDPIRTLSAAE